MKFALLHVDQAVELLLKERVRAGGKSIHKPNNSKETISIWGAYEVLTKELKVAIPEKTDLELLHEERNNIQHNSYIIQCIHILPNKNSRNPL